MFWLPVVKLLLPSCPELLPIQVLWSPVLISLPAVAPIAVLCPSPPEEGSKFSNANLPTAVLKLPSTLSNRAW